jgi:hypothetical protein
MPRRSVAAITGGRAAAEYLLVGLHTVHAAEQDHPLSSWIARLGRRSGAATAGGRPATSLAHAGSHLRNRPGRARSASQDWHGERWAAPSGPGERSSTVCPSKSPKSLEMQSRHPHRGPRSRRLPGESARACGRATPITAGTAAMCRKSLHVGSSPSPGRRGKLYLSDSCIEERTRAAPGCQGGVMTKHEVNSRRGSARAAASVAIGPSSGGPLATKYAPPRVRAVRSGCSPRMKAHS